MKIFIFVIVIATVIGGIIGGELTDQNFTILGAAIGGVSTFSILMGLGAFFDHQDKKSERAKLAPEMRGVFDRPFAAQSAGEPPSRARQLSNEASGLNSIEATMLGLIEQDRKDMANGNILERRLIPHHAIKRDVIIKIFEADFAKLSASMKAMNQDHFQAQILEIRTWDQQKLDRMIETMKNQRSDLEDIEKVVRAERPIYNIVSPLF